MDMVASDPQRSTEGQPRSETRILSLSSTYPTVWQPSLGVFVRGRLQAIGRLADLCVVAPIAVFEFGNRARPLFVSAKTPNPDATGCLNAIRPRWFYPPFGGVLNSVFLFVQVLPHVVRLRRTFPFNVIDAHFGHPDGIAAALLGSFLRCPFTITLRGNETLHAKHFFRGYALRWAVRRAACVITVSERLRQFAISSGADAERVVTIPNGVDTDVFHPNRGRRSRHLPTLPASARVILSAGYLIERKGHHFIIRALKALNARGIRAHLVIAGGGGGEGKFEPVLRKLVAELELEEQVHFCGAVPPAEMPELMSSVNLLCLASSREGWPNVVHEALACGTPVVATDIGGVPDMLPSDDYGIIVPPGDQVALNDALARALGKSWDRKAISAWGMSRSWNTVAVETVAVLNRASKTNLTFRGTPQCAS